MLPNGLRFSPPRLGRAGGAWPAVYDSTHFTRKVIEANSDIFSWPKASCCSRGLGLNSFMLN
jgi:hypothetical protein